jgi:uncharacterized protein YgiM (DUF1202 family)
MARKKPNSNVVGWVIIGIIAFGIFQFWVLGDKAGPANAATSPTSSSETAQSHSTPGPLNTPRFVNVASVNVRHTPSTSGELIMTLSRGTKLKVLERREGWLLVDLSPTLEGWVAERLTTTKVLQRRYVPPASLADSR